MSVQSHLKVRRGTLFIIIFFSLFLFGNTWAAENGPGEETGAGVDDLSLAAILNMDIESVAFFTMSARTSPNTVYLVDVPEYTDGAFRTSEDILYMDAPGVITARHSRHGTLVGMRGVLVDNNAKTLFMLDGQQFNQRMHFGYTSGLQTALMGDMERMEIIYGPGAIAHGSGAINGFVNYIPKNGTDSPGGFAKFEYGFQEKLYKGETGYGFSYGEGKDLYLYAGMYGELQRRRIQ